MECQIMKLQVHIFLQSLKINVRHIIKKIIEEYLLVEVCYQKFLKQLYQMN